LIYKDFLKVWVQVFLATGHQIAESTTSFCVIHTTIVVLFLSVFATRIGKDKTFGNANNFAIVIAIATNAITYIVTNFVCVLCHASS
jgi:hypothetical protein